jgi:hypothetical protein
MAGSDHLLRLRNPDSVAATDSDLAVDEAVTECLPILEYRRNVLEPMMSSDERTGYAGQREHQDGDCKIGLSVLPSASLFPQRRPATGPTEGGIHGNVY